MARWQLLQPHYLNIPGNVWEYIENDRITQKPKRTQFVVPRLLDPDDPTEWTHRQLNALGQPIEGTIVVAYEGKNEPNDLIFIGEPTPDMKPLDDEAKKISTELAKTRWKTPVNETSDRGYADVVLRALETQMNKVAETAKPASMDGMEQLLAAMTALTKQNAELIGALAGNQPAGAVGRRA